MARGRPSTYARGLGAELQALRAAGGLSTRAAAQLLGWSASTLNRLETGNREADRAEVEALLALYKVVGGERDRLLALVDTADRAVWWETSGAAVPSQLSALIGFESQATTITNVETVNLSGLLQTPDYTRALLQGHGLTMPDIETKIAIRLGRQARLRQQSPPRFIALLDEASIRRPVGGPSVMAAQLRHILRVARRPNVVVQVLPFELGAHPGLDGPYVVLTFAKARTIVHLEHKKSSLFLDKQATVETFVETTARLRDLALDPVGSARLIAETAAEYEKHAR